MDDQSAMKQLAEATARVSIRHDNKGAWIDIQLDIWDAYRERQQREGELSCQSSMK